LSSVTQSSQVRSFALLRMTALKLVAAAPVRSRFVSYEMFRDCGESFRQLWRESPRREAPHFLRRVLRSPTYRRECRPAFALWIKANRVPGVSIESEHREQVAMCEQQSRPPNALRRPRLR